MEAKTRPMLRIGDIVKLSKKGQVFPRSFSIRSTMVVSRIQGNSTDNRSIITCRIRENGEFKYHTFYRSELWYTGKNAFYLNTKSVVKFAN